MPAPREMPDGFVLTFDVLNIVVVSLAAKPVLPVARPLQ
jgi:hypothetical protein